jgi:hypothetical protein
MEFVNKVVQPGQRITQRPASRGKYFFRISLSLAALACLLPGRPALANYVNPLYLSGVPGTVLGALVWGGAGNSHYGETVTGVGDVNGDGFDDVIIAGQRVQVGANFGAGEAILFYGTRGSFGSSMVLNLFTDVMTASQGVRFQGTAGNQNLGRSLAGAGDVNGDGYNDFLIGSSENADKGTVYLIYGKNPVSATLTYSLNASVLNGTNGVAIVGNTDDYIGYDVNKISGAGDVNGDGYDDILVAGNNRVFLIYGSASGIGAGGLLDLASFAESDGVVMTGSGSIQSLGTAVSGAGDVNGDGYDDILLGAWKVYLAPVSTDDTGGGVILYGSAAGIGAAGALTVSETTLDGDNGTRFIGPSPWGSAAGQSVSGVGDVNGDGYADFEIGAYNWGYWTTFANQGNGRVYLVYGDPAPYDSLGTYFMINLDGSNGVKLNSPTNYVYAGRRLSSAGDLNGDGLADLAIPAYYEDSQAGRTYVVYGKQGTILNSSDYDLGSIFTQDGTKMIGANLYGASEKSGSDIGNAGDFNGDGKSDILIGAQDANNPNGGSVGCGKAYLVWGDGFPASAVVKGFTRAGDAPKRGVGMMGDGQHTYPLSRVWVDYDDGSASGGASLETVTFYRDTLAAPGLPTNVAYGYWQVTTNRTGWGQAALTFKYSLNDIGVMDPSKLKIYQSDSPAGPFTRLATVSNTTNQTLSATVTGFSYFVIGEPDPGPEIDIRGNGVSIANGDTSPSTTDGTSFGSAEINAGTVDHTFTIHNLGIDDLTLTGGTLVSITGPHAGDFSVTVDPDSTIASDGSSDFVVRFAPSAAGERLATVSIANDDTDENPYEFAIQGGEVSGASFYVIKAKDGKTIIFNLKKQ